jgi:hypothetical protein
MRNRQCLCRVARFAYFAWNCRIVPKERDSCPNRPKPLPNFGLCLQFCTVQNHLHRPLRAIQIVTNLGKTARKSWEEL